MKFITVSAIVALSVSATHTSHKGSKIGYPVATASAQVRSMPVSKTEPVYFCPEGYLLRDTVCEQILSEQPQLVCPAGYELYSSDCVRRVAMLNICPPGYLKTAEGCQRTVSENILRYCPEGHVESARGGCERQVILDLIPQCAHTHKLHGHSCHRQLEVEPLAYCPDGFIPTDSGFNKHGYGLCERQITYDCTHGLRRQLTMIYEKPQHPVTTHLDIQKTCTKREVVKMLFRCPPGSVPSHDLHKCLQEEQIAANFVCPGLSDAGNCYRLESAAYIYECPAGTTKRCGGGNYKHHGHGHNAQTYDDCVCERIEPMAFAQACPEGFIEGQDGCQQLAEVRVVCPPGYVLEGDVCLRTTHIPASCEFTVTYRCEGGCIIN